MKKFDLDDFVKGWIVGNFEPTLLANKFVEVGVKFFLAGDREPRHKQLTSTEITVVAQGEILLEGSRFSKGDIIMIPPGEFADFLSITDSSVICVKFPSIPNDKVFE